MSRLTIDFGIDLGTTNSSVAVCEKNGPRILRNNEGWQFTPSAVWVNKSNALRVGMEARERAFSDPDNGALEFKLMMGRDHSVRMARLNRSYKPEELSAEVLKALKGDVQRETGEDLDAAVIAVPADFDQPASEATRRAAQLAGITLSPLLQEPVAAALAYGFQREQENAFWLVFDIGGGTFDAAVIQVREGTIEVLNHGGDNELGGKLIDWAIVERLFLPALFQSWRLHEFHRGNRKWTAAFAKLKYLAEKAKIALSKDQSYDIADEFVCISDAGEPVTLDVCVSRNELEELAAPLVRRSINICRKVLEQQRLHAGDIAKLILVGGPTLTPYIRRVLPDAREGLGIPIDFSMDPLLVVSQGAALFAATQRRTASPAPLQPGQFNLILEYKPVGVDEKPMVGVRVQARDPQSFLGYTLIFRNRESRPPWDSGRLPLTAEGTLIATLLAQSGGQNLFTVELHDPRGAGQLLSPSEFPYTVGLAITNPPSPHDVGIAMADNKVDVLFSKGAPLPAEARAFHLSTHAVRRSESGSRLLIPLVEGPLAAHADLNRRIGNISIDSGSMQRDLPAGSEVEIRLELDTSRLLTGWVYIPFLDQEFKIVLVDGLLKPNPSWHEMQSEFEQVKQRWVKLTKLAQQPAYAKIKGELTRMKDEGTLDDITRLLAAGDDPDVNRTCENRMLTLKIVLQGIEDELAHPRLIAEAAEVINLTRQAIAESGTEEDQMRFDLLLPELETAVYGDIEPLKIKVKEMWRVRGDVLARSPQYWIDWIDELRQRHEQMQDSIQARLWFAHADRAIKNGDHEAVKAACRQLWSLLPREQQERGYGGNTVRSLLAHA